MIPCPRCGSQFTYRNERVTGWFRRYTNGDNTEMWDDPRLTWKVSKRVHCADCKHSFTPKGA